MRETIFKKVTGIFIIVVFGCMLMSFVDGIWQPGYVTKSILKMVAFLIIPICYSYFNKDILIKDLFVVNPRGIIRAIGLGVGVYIFILACYFTIGSFFDFSQVTGALSENVGVNRENFIFVAIYISFINSLLEELFFRGFAFLNLRKLAGRRFAYCFSSLCFALYHIAMMIGWFSFLLTLILLTGLIVAGILFNWLNEKQGNIYSSWFVHMFANFAINTVGFMLFGLI
ncbi:MAG: CPBP family intramembrane glutamic endopeptidase [Aminipila sp.]